MAQQIFTKHLLLQILSRHWKTRKNQSTNLRVCTSSGEARPHGRTQIRKWFQMWVTQGWSREWFRLTVPQFFWSDSLSKKVKFKARTKGWEEAVLLSWRKVMCDRLGTWIRWVKTGPHDSKQRTPETQSSTQIRLHVNAIFLESCDAKNINK